MCKHVSEVRLSRSMRRIIYCSKCGINLTEHRAAMRLRNAKRRSWKEKNELNMPVLPKRRGDDTIR